MISASALTTDPTICFETRLISTVTVLLVPPVILCFKRKTSQPPDLYLAKKPCVTQSSLPKEPTLTPDCASDPNAPDDVSTTSQASLAPLGETAEFAVTVTLLFVQDALLKSLAL